MENEILLSVSSASEIGANEMAEIDFCCGDSEFCRSVLSAVLLKHGIVVQPGEFLIADMMPESLLVDIYNYLFVEMGYLPFCND